MNQHVLLRETVDKVPEEWKKDHKPRRLNPALQGRSGDETASSLHPENPFLTYSIDSVTSHHVTSFASHCLVTSHHSEMCPISLRLVIDIINKVSEHRICKGNCRMALAKTSRRS